MDNKELISQEKLISLLNNYCIPRLDGELRFSTDGYFYYRFPRKPVLTGRRYISVILKDDHYEIYNEIQIIEGRAHIQIFNDHIEFIDGSTYCDFTRDDMNSLYTFLDKGIFGIKEEENNKMNDKKELMSHDGLKDIINQYITPKLAVCDRMGGNWKATNFYPSGCVWNLSCDNNAHLNCAIGFCLCDDHWDICSDYHSDKTTNIKVFEGHVEFIEDSEFGYFDKEFMRGLYRKIKLYVGDGGNIKEETKEDEHVMNNDKKNSKKSDVKNKLFISQPMTGYDDNEIREYRKRVHRIVSIMFDDPDIELIEQFDVDESNVDFSGMNEAQIRMYRLNRSLSMLMDANIVVFAPNWWKSPGCIEEWIQCQLYTSPSIILGSAIETVDNTLYNAPITDDYDYDEETRIIETIDTVFKNIKRPSTDTIVDIPEIKLNSSLTKLHVIGNIVVCDKNYRKYVLAVMKKFSERRITGNDVIDGIFKKIGLADPKVDDVKPSNDILVNDDSETDTDNNVEEESSIIEQDNSLYKFNQYIKEHCEDDAYNDYWYALLIHNKLLDIMENVMFDRFGDGNTEVKTEYSISKFGNFVAYTIFAPINHNKEYHVITFTSLTKYHNDEWCASHSMIEIYDIKDKETSKPFKYQYLPSQEGPETDDRITNQVLVDYVGSAHIPHSDRKMFSRINSEFKAFINDRDDIVWKKDK